MALSELALVDEPRRCLLRLLNRDTAGLIVVGAVSEVSCDGSSGTVLSLSGVRVKDRACPGEPRWRLAGLTAIVRSMGGTNRIGGGKGGGGAGLDGGLLLGLAADSLGVESLDPLLTIPPRACTNADASLNSSSSSSSCDA